jgi:hypothetical protein
MRLFGRVPLVPVRQGATSTKRCTARADDAVDEQTKRNAQTVSCSARTKHPCTLKAPLVRCQQTMLVQARTIQGNAK